MNEHLRSLLEESNRTLSDLSSAVSRLSGVQIDRTTPYRWLKGVTPRANIRAAVAAVLGEWTGRPVTVADLGWETNYSVPAFRVTSTGWSVRSIRQSLGEELGEAVNRRTYLEHSGMQLASLANQWLLEPVEELEETINGRRIGTSTVADIEAITERRRRMDDATGGGMLLPAVREDLRLSITLLKRASFDTEVGKGLYAAIAEQARLVSWLAFDSGLQGVAQRYTHLAVQAAYAAEDWQIGSNILAYASRQAAVRGDVTAAESLARSALSGGRGQLTPKVEASIHARLGNARGRMGDDYGSRTAFEAAETLLADSNPDEEPAWIYWFGRGDQYGLSGEAAFMAGQYDRAVQDLAVAVENMGIDMLRDQALWLSAQAASYAKGGDLEQGRSVAERALALVGDGMESEHVFAKLDGQFCAAVRELNPSAADEFHERLVAQMAEGDTI